MKYEVQIKQIRNGSDPKTAEWVQGGDVVECLAMAMAYAEIVARDFGSPTKVMTVGEGDDVVGLIGRVIAYFGPAEHTVAVDYFDFVANGTQYRTDAASRKIEAFNRKAGGWVTFRTFELTDEERQEFYVAKSKALYGA